jgi:hypothetical protein
MRRKVNRRIELTKRKLAKKAFREEKKRKAKQK